MVRLRPAVPGEPAPTVPLAAVKQEGGDRVEKIKKKKRTQLLPARTGAGAGIRRATRRVRFFGEKSVGYKRTGTGKNRSVGYTNNAPLRMHARTVEGAPDKLKCTVLASAKQDKNIGKGPMCNSQAYDPIQQGHHSRERAHSKSSRR